MSEPPSRTPPSSAAERAARRAAERAGRASEGPGPRSRRPRAVPLALAVGGALLALLVGLLLGYRARGDAPPPAPITVERDVTVVTVTVPQAPAP